MSSRLSIWLFLSFLVLYVALTRGHFFTIDEVEVYEQTRALWQHGDLAIPRQFNSIQGPDGRSYVPFNAGQSILAVPLFAAGSGLRRLAEKLHADSWNETFAGPVIGERGRRWGGEIEIFTVNLFNAFVVAALIMLFFRFNLALGVETLWAVVAAVLLGLTTHVAGFSSGFFQHPAEALFLLASFYCLFLDSRNPDWRLRVLGGVFAAWLILVRPSGVILIPALAGYTWWVRREGVALQFLSPIAAAMFFTALVNYSKWGAFSFTGAYHDFTHGPFLTGLYGFLFSPGGSILLFSPLLLAAPFYFRAFARRYPKETVAIFAISLSYLLFYSKVPLWHGQWCFGPRYLMALVPLLLLPLGGWLQQAGNATRMTVGTLALAGFFVEILHFAVNVSYVYYREKYGDLSPSYAYVFIPDISQIATHFQALVAGDERVDMWLVNVARSMGLGRVCLLLLPLATVFIVSVRRILFYLGGPRAWTMATRIPVRAPQARFDF